MAYWEEKDLGRRVGRRVLSQFGFNVRRLLAEWIAGFSPIYLPYWEEACAVGHRV